MKQQKLDQLLESGVFSFSLDTKKIEKKDYIIERSFPQDDLSSIKEGLDLLSLDSFSFKAHIKPLGKKKFQLYGHIKAEGAQASVVDFSPVDFIIDETFEIEFIPAQDLDDEAQTNLEEIFIDVEEHIQDVYEGEALALGAAIYQQFMVALDPYPKQEGQSFNWEDDDDEMDHPFAVLKQIVPKQTN